ncbi:MAG TPA: peptide ABC transporter substrate-binding protein, partial [Anaerolineae bacterium]|nr:peptide ABC transporter substrate-binding protein [Anaerolineae bacterium]
SLYRYTGDGTIEPAGAVSYEVSEDGTVYTVYLRQDATWSDGEPVLAQHYVDGILRLLNPETAAEYSYVMWYISGAEAYNLGETDDPSTVGVRAVDDYTLEFTLDSPQAFFDSILAFFTTYPIRLDVIEEYGDLWTEPGNFVGNGPYVLTEWAHEDHVTVEKNPNYHDADAVTIERVEYPIIVEDSTALAAYERGELDTSGYPSEELPRILEEMREHFVRIPRPGTYYVGLNTALGATQNLNFRKALASAIDKRAILDAVLNMSWRLDACGVIPPEIPGYQGCGNVGYQFDLEAAQRYLQAAMEEMGVEEPGDITIQLWFNRGNEDVIESVEEQWETNLGIKVNVVNMEWGAYLEVLDSCND